MTVAWLRRSDGCFADYQFTDLLTIHSFAHSLPNMSLESAILAEL